MKKLSFDFFFFFKLLSVHIGPCCYYAAEVWIPNKVNVLYALVGIEKNSGIDF